jgi:acyl-CoA reductase-like NAD-dependent aldehyde dehydrogenase
LCGNIEDQPGYFIPITIVDNPPEDSRVVTEEAFGPVLPVIKYNDYEDVIKKANNTDYGLAGSVWGKDLNLPVPLQNDWKLARYGLMNFKCFLLTYLLGATNNQVLGSRIQLKV